jgi:hypothetical protein
VKVSLEEPVEVLNQTLSEDTGLSKCTSLESICFESRIIPLATGYILSWIGRQSNCIQASFFA